MEETIRLREQGSRTVRLLPEELRAVQKILTNRLDLRLTEEPGVYKLSAGPHVGVVVLPSGRTLIIEPKTSIETLFALLSTVYDPRKEIFREDPHGYTSVEALFEFMVRAFVAHVEDLVTRGLLRGYREAREDLTTVRGRVLLHESLAHRPGLHDRHWCAYHRFTTDVLENRILCWTLFCLQPLPYKDHRLPSRLRRCVRAMGGVTLYPQAGDLLQKVTFNRLNARYDRALGLAQLLLEHLTFSGTPGEHLFFCYLVDMNWLFERYVEAVLQRGLQGLEVRGQEGHYLDREDIVRVIPDVVLYRAGDQVLAVDAKYKLEPSQGDLYQMVAYCHALGIRRAVLVHPATEQPPKDRVRVRGPGDLEITYLALSLEGGPEQLEETASRLAQQVAAIALPLHTEPTPVAPEESTLVTPR